MKKIYAVLATMLMSSVAFAQSAITTENPVLDEMGYRLEKDVDWYEGTVNGVSFLMDGYVFGSGADALSYTAADNGIVLNAYGINRCTNEGLEWFYLQLTGNGVTCEPGLNGLHTTKNERWFALEGLRGNQIIAFELADTTEAQFVLGSTACSQKTGWADTMVEPAQAFEISDSIHALQELANGEGSADMCRYYRVNPESDGWIFVKFNGKSQNKMWRLQIWSSKDDAEVVSAPMFSVKGVDYEARWINVKDGQSTFNNPVFTYYSLEGAEPLYLKDTDKIDYIDSIAVTDPETGDTIDWNVETHYVQVAYQENGEWGDFLYDPSLGADSYIAISSNDDEDGDGYVTVKARSITAGGVFSPVTEQSFAVGEIQLNAPELTLVGMEGEDRQYQIGWNNNTLCGEEVTLSVNVDGTDIAAGTYNFGDVVNAKSTLTAKVECEGYNENETSIDVFDAGETYYTKDGGKYFWDFVNLTEEQIEKVDHQYVTSAYLVLDENPTDTTWFSRDEYLAYEGEYDPEPVYGWFGWDELDSRQVGRHWQSLLRDSTIVTGSEGQDSIVYTFAYADDQCDLFHDGFEYENSYGGTYPDYWSNTAIFTNGALMNDGNHGLYNNSNHATIHVPDVQYGEYVVYVTSTGSVCEPCQVTWDEVAQQNVYGYSKDLGKNIYLYSVAVMTKENLPDMIEKVNNNAVVLKDVMYDLSGRVVTEPTNGIYIKNGKKFFVK